LEGFLKSRTLPQLPSRTGAVLSIYILGFPKNIEKSSFFIYLFIPLFIIYLFISFVLPSVHKSSDQHVIPHHFLYVFIFVFVFVFFWIRGDENGGFESWPENGDHCGTTYPQP